MNQPAGGGLGPTRQETVDALCEHFANDVLTVEEFERRVDRAQRAESVEELRRLLADLPGGALPATVRPEGEQTPAPLPPQALASRVKERRVMVACLGGVERKGRWMPARRNYAVAVMGGLELDFREALLPPGVTEVWIFTMMGGAEIIVPPGLSVEADGVAILGSFGHREEASLAAEPEAPLLRLRGVTVMGGVEVSIRYPGESSREAKRRRRLERKRRKQLRDGS